MSVNAMSVYPFTLSQNTQNIIANAMSNLSVNSFSYSTPYMFGSGFTTQTGSTSSSDSSSSVKVNESYDEYMKRVEKEKKQKLEKENKAKELAKKKKEFEKKQLDATSIAETLNINIENATTQKTEDGTTTTASVEDIEAALKKQEEKLNNSKTKKDGSALLDESLEEYRKKTPFLKRALRTGVNIWQGTWKLMENFAGFEDGKINWKKALKNIGIAAGVVAACAIPVIGPVLSYGLLAVGLGAGAYGVGKGIYNATQAKTVNEMDNAVQNISASAAIGIASAAGLRGMGRTISGVQPQASTSLGSKAMNLFKEFKPANLKQSLTDMTVNSFKAAKNNMSLSKTAVRNNGFWKTLFNNEKSTFGTPLKNGFTNLKNKAVQKYQTIRHPNIQWSWRLFYKAPWKAIKTAGKTAVWAIDLPYKPWRLISKTSAGSEFSIQRAIKPEQGCYMFAETLTKDEMTTQKEAIAQYLDEIQKQRDAITA